jgi:hypothetical protein
MEGDISQRQTLFDLVDNLLALATHKNSEEDASNRAILQSSLDYVDGTVYLLRLP